MARRALALVVALLALACLAAAGAPTHTAGAGVAPRLGLGGTARYIVVLSGPAPGLATTQAAALAAIAALTGGPSEPIYTYRHALSGFALELTPAEAAAVAALPGVVGVEPEPRYTLDATPAPALIGAAQSDLRPALFFAQLSGARAVPPVAGTAEGRAVAHYAADTRRLSFQVFYRGLSGAPGAAFVARGAPDVVGPALFSLTPAAVGTPGVDGGYIGAQTLDDAGERALFAGELYVTLASEAAPGGELRGQLVPARGEGVVLGVLDTGVNVSHPAFQDPAPDGYDHRNPRGAGGYLGVCSPDAANERYDPSFACNDKLIGAYTFADTASVPDPRGRPSPRDNQGHGSHVAAIAAGNVLSAAPDGPLAGVAPHAGLIAYDVCGLPASGKSCSGSAILAAIDQAVADRVDVLNLSFSSESRNPWSAVETMALLRATGAGIFVTTSAGNGGPAPGSLGTPGNAPWATGVGSTAHDAVLQGEQAGFDLLQGTSARGPDLHVPDLLKPDLAAPGVSIVAAGADVGTAAPDYLTLSGTSMAAPHVAGLAALLRQIHPDWSPAELRSAMALTGLPVHDQGAAAGPFAQGGGRIAAIDAALAGFVLDIGEEAYRAADPAQGGHPSALNLPALIDHDCVGGCVFTRTLRSTLGVPVTWELSGSGSGFTVAVSPPGPLTLAPGAAATIHVHVAITAPKQGAIGFGKLHFVARDGLAPAAAMPIAVALKATNLPGELNLITTERNGGAAIALRTMAIDELTVHAYGLTRLQPELVRLGPDPTPEDYGDSLAGGIYRQIVPLPVGNVRLRAAIEGAPGSELNLVVYVDRAGAGFGELGPEDTLLCRHSDPGSSAQCDLLAPNLVSGRAEAIQATILVQNAGGTDATEERIMLLWGHVDAGAGSLRARGPGQNPAGQPFELSLGWALGEAQVGDRFIGVLSLGQGPAAAGGLGSALVNLEFATHRVYLPVMFK